METVTRLLLPDVAEALDRDPKLVLELTEELNPVDLAELVAELDDDRALALLRAFPVPASAQLLEFLDRTRRVALFQRLAEKELAAAVAIAEEMAPDERADLFGELAEDLRAALLGKMEQEESRDVRQLLGYREGTAGALMTTNFVALSAEETVGRAIERVRQSASEMETIYEAYAVDPNGTLLGAVSLRDLVLAGANKPVAEIMDPNVPAVSVDDDQEEVTKVIAKYDLIALPVIDHARNIVGIITVDDAVDVIEEEATEDVQRLGAVAPLENPYFQTGFWQFVTKRAPWLIVLFVAGFLTSGAMRHFTDTFEQIAALVWFVPLIIASGGTPGRSRRRS